MKDSTPSLDHLYDTPVDVDEFLSGKRSKLSLVPIHDGLDEMLDIKEMIQSEEAYVVAKKNKTKFAVYLFTHPKLKKRVTKNTLGDMPEYRFLVPYDGFAKHANLHGGMVPFRDATLYDLMGGIMQDDRAHPFYVIDDDTKEYVGFLSYAKKTQQSKVIDEVKFFNFDKVTGSMYKDTLRIMVELSKNHNEIHWTAIADPTNPVVPIYKMYIEHKKREGCVASVTIKEEPYFSVDAGGEKTIEMFCYTVKFKK